MLLFFHPSALVKQTRNRTAPVGSSDLMTDRSLLLESEHRRVFRTVIQPHSKSAARSGPWFVGLPDVSVPIQRRVIAKTTASRVDRFFDLFGRLRRIASNGDRCRITHG